MMSDIETWVEQCIAGLDVAFPLPAQNSKLQGLSLENAIREHVLWLNQWRAALNKDDERFRSDVVCQDDQCHLGKWILSLKDPIVETEQYAQLKQQHAQFHVLAADIIDAYRHGDLVKAFARSRSDLLAASKRVAVALVALDYAYRSL